MWAADETGRETVRKRRVREQASQRREFPQDKERERSKRKRKKNCKQVRFFQEEILPSTSREMTSFLCRGRLNLKNPRKLVKPVKS